MTRKIDHEALRDILDEENVYADIVQVLVEQWLGIQSSTTEVPIPGGGKISPISEAGVQFLLDAEVLTDEDPE